MPTLNIDGVGRVSVDDSFLKLSPEQQAATVDEIVSSQKAPSQPQAAQPTQPTAPAAPKPAPERTWMQTADDVIRGAADTLTFGLADEAAAGLSSLFGNKTYDQALAEERQRNAESGTGRIVGQVGGALVPFKAVTTLANKALGLLKATPTAAKTGAAAGAITGGAYGFGSGEGGVENRVFDGALGAATGTVLGGVGGKVVDKVANAIPSVRAAKMAEGRYAAMDAEIIRDLANIQAKPTTSSDLISKQRNQLGTQYIDGVKKSLKDAGYKLTDDMRNAIKARDVVTPEQLATIRNQPGGNAVADALTKYQRLVELTKPEAAAGGTSRVIRGAVDMLPLPTPVNRGLQSALGTRVTTEQKIKDLTANSLMNPNLKAAELVSERLGPSVAAQSAKQLVNVGKQNINRQNQIAATRAVRAEELAQRRQLQETALAKVRAPYAEGTTTNGASPQAVLVEAFEDATGIKHKAGMVQDVLKAIKKDPELGAAFGKDVDQAIRALGNKPGRLDNLTNLVRAVRAKASAQQAAGELKIRGGQTAEQGAGRIRNEARYNAKVISETIRDVLGGGQPTAPATSGVLNQVTSPLSFATKEAESAFKKATNLHPETGNSMLDVFQETGSVQDVIKNLRTAGARVGRGPDKAAVESRNASFNTLADMLERGEISLGGSGQQTTSGVLSQASSPLSFANKEAEQVFNKATNLHPETGQSMLDLFQETGSVSKVIEQLRTAGARVGRGPDKAAVESRNASFNKLADMLERGEISLGGGKANPNTGVLAQVTPPAGRLPQLDKSLHKVDLSTAEDDVIEEYAAAVRKLKEDPLTVDTIEGAVLSGVSNKFVVYDGKKIAGAVSYDVDEPAKTVFIDMIGSLKKGTGKQMLGEALSGIPDDYKVVLVSSKSAHGFWKKLGFKSEGKGSLIGTTVKDLKGE